MEDLSEKVPDRWRQNRSRLANAVLIQNQVFSNKSYLQCGEGGNEEKDDWKNFCGFMLLNPFLPQINFSKTGMTLVNRRDQGVLPNRGIIVLCRYVWHCWKENISVAGRSLFYHTVTYQKILILFLPSAQLRSKVWWRTL